MRCLAEHLFIPRGLYQLRREQPTKGSEPSEREMFMPISASKKSFWCQKLIITGNIFFLSCQDKRKLIGQQSEARLSMNRQKSNKGALDSCTHFLLSSFHLCQSQRLGPQKTSIKLHTAFSRSKIRPTKHSPAQHLPAELGPSFLLTKGCWATGVWESSLQK